MSMLNSQTTMQAFSPKELNTIVDVVVVVLSSKSSDRKESLVTLQLDGTR